MGKVFKHNGNEYSTIGDEVVQLTYLVEASEIYIPKYAICEDKRYEVRHIAPFPVNDYYTVNVETDGRRKPKYEKRWYKKIVNILANEINISSSWNSTAKIHFHNNIRTIGDYAFYNFCKIKNLELPTGLKEIGNYSFYGCEELETLYLPNGLSSIGNQAFAKCAHIKSLLIPTSVTSIGSKAFYDCKNLVRVVIGPGIKSIGEYAFNYDKWSNLKHVDIYADPFEVMVAPNAFPSMVQVSYHNPKKYTQKNIAPSLKAELSVLMSSLLDSCCDGKTEIIENYSTNLKNNSNDIDIEKLITAVLVDGSVTEKERAVILKKATAAGYDPDEVEIILDARLHEKLVAEKQTEEPVEKKKPEVKLANAGSSKPEKEVTPKVADDSIVEWAELLWEPIKDELLKQVKVKLSIPKGKPYAILSSENHKGLLQYILQYSVRDGEAIVRLETYGGEDAKNRFDVKIAASHAVNPIKHATISQGQRNKDKWAWTIGNKIDKSDASLITWYVETLLAVYAFMEDITL